MPEHRLDPLLQPSSIALLGASEREGSPGLILARMVMESTFIGTVYPVNPGYQQILGKPCYPDLDALPQRVEHVVIAIGNARLEEALGSAIEHGAKAATIYSSGVLEQDSNPPLKQRLSDMARAAGLQLCGINGMGFYNLEQQLYAGIFARPDRIQRGSISYIAQSGSAFTALVHNGCRLGFNLCVSAGDEMTTTVADYMDWCLERDDTRVIGLFLETVRAPEAFVAALEKANARNIPVVILKIGKSDLAASMAITHTGAIAGDHAIFNALCRSHGVITVDDFNEMAAILMLLQTGYEPIDGGFAAAFESGGFRELVTDTADAIGIDFAPLEEATRSILALNLDPGLEAENPLDLWGSHDRFEARMEACLRALIEDPNVSACAFFSNFRDGYFLSEAIYQAIETIAKDSNKPLVLVNCFSDLANTKLCQRAVAAGIPIIDGTRESLLAFSRLFAYRDFKQQQSRKGQPIEPRGQQDQTWRRKLNRRSSETLGESEALALLGDFEIPVVGYATIATEVELLNAASTLGYPVVLKTAQPDINHKSDCGGVIVGIENEQTLLYHYRDMTTRLGPMALLSQMVEEGVEVALGTVNDHQFGPVIMVAAGGILVELLDDREMAMCPLDYGQVSNMLDSLKFNRLLNGVRGQPPVNRAGLTDIVVKLSQLAFQLRDSIAEIDINPVIVNKDRAVAVDALIQCRCNKP